MRTDQLWWAHPGPPRGPRNLIPKTPQGDAAGVPAAGTAAGPADADAGVDAYIATSAIAGTAPAEAAPAGP